MTESNRYQFRTIHKTMPARTHVTDRFGFDSRREKLKEGDDSNCAYPDGIPMECISIIKVPLGPSFGCEPSKLVVTALVADEGFISLPITRVPVKLTSAKINGCPMLPQECYGDGFLVGVTPTEDDLFEHDGSPYRQEGKVEELPPKEKEEIFRTMSSLDISNWRYWDCWTYLYLTFENVIREPIHIFGYVEGYALKGPEDIRG